MLGFNKVFVMGNLTRDPELKYTPNGQAVASFGMATNRRWTTPEGERREEAEFHNMVVWGRAAETINQYMKKGNPLFVEGRLKTNNWEGPDGVKRQRTEIIIDQFQFLGSGGGQQNNNQNQQAPAPAAPPVAQNPNQNFGQQATPPISNTQAPVVDTPPVAENKPVTENKPVEDKPNDNPFASDSGTTPTDQANPDDISIEDIPF